MSFASSQIRRGESHNNNDDLDKQGFDDPTCNMASVPLDKWEHLWQSK
jgi:hypothetical protein